MLGSIEKKIKLEYYININVLNCLKISVNITLNKQIVIKMTRLYQLNLDKQIIITVPSKTMDLVLFKETFF